MVNYQKEGKFYRKRVTEDHYVMLSEPGSEYFGHVTCESGTAKGIKSTVLTYLKTKSVELSEISVVGCDGTVINTGFKGGVIRLMEEELKKPLQWIVCQLHSNELPLRHLLLHLDGKTTGPKCFSGKHMWQTISLSRYLNPDLKKIVDKVIQQNGYFGHPENVLVAMLGDDKESIRELAYQRILKARSENAPGLRTFKVPALNFNAEHYTEMIPWQDYKVTEPPLTYNLSDEALKSIVKSGLGTVQNIKDFPCHIQAVERCIKLVTEASSAVCGEHKRDGFIRARILSRQQMPHFDTRKQFCV